MKQGLLIIISGPSGVGKGTLVKKLNRDRTLPAAFSISMTTRPRRLKEVNGREYQFVSQSEFAQHIKHNDFLEYVEYCGYYYGTPKKYVDDNLKLGKSIVLEIDVEGAEKVMKLYPGMYTLAVFIMPPNNEELERRIRMRHTEEEEKIQERLEKAKKEIDYKKDYDVSLTNYTINKTAKRLLQVIDNRIAYVDAVEEGRPTPADYVIKRP